MALAAIKVLNKGLALGLRIQVEGVPAGSSGSRKGTCKAEEAGQMALISR